MTAADPSFSEQPLGLRLGRYELLGKLARGGMATVYIARAVGVAGFSRLYAVKVLHPHLADDESFIAMFLDEARIAASIHHPNVVATHDISDSRELGFYLVMDYVEGGHLGALLRRAFDDDEELPVPVAARILLDMLEGLSSAHEGRDAEGNLLNLIHRDVSPHNVLVGVDGVARLTDFGIAKAQVRLSATQDGNFKGKLSYMSPEQAISGPLDARTDIFSAGIVLWETLTLSKLIQKATAQETYRSVIHFQAPSITEHDPKLAPFESVIKKALAPKPADRFQSVSELAEAFEKAAQSFGELASRREVGRYAERLLAPSLHDTRSMIRRASERLGPIEITNSGERRSDPSTGSRRLERTSELPALGLDLVSVSISSVSDSDLHGVAASRRTVAIAVVAVALFAFGLGWTWTRLTTLASTTATERAEPFQPAELPASLAENPTPVPVPAPVPNVVTTPEGATENQSAESDTTENRGAESDTAEDRLNTHLAPGTEDSDSGAEPLVDSTRPPGDHDDELPRRTRESQRTTRRHVAPPRRAQRVESPVVSAPPTETPATPVTSTPSPSPQSHRPPSRNSGDNANLADSLELNPYRSGR